MKIIILGPPAAGKGTQGELLAKRLGLPRLSPGAVLRRLWREGGRRSEEIGEYVLKGLNVPAELLFEALTPWFAQHKDGFIIDNLPRTFDQLEEFKKFLSKTGMKIDKVFHISISEKESLERTARRHQERLKSGNARPDEVTGVTKTRITEGYQKDIKPILDFFKKLGVLVEINGEQSIEEVHRQILESLKIK